VGSYPPNAWGLYDMHGNVLEWCLSSMSVYSAAPVTDPFVTSNSNRVQRGGSWFDSSHACRSAWRRSSAPTSKGFTTFVFVGYGFRVVLAPILVP
jgi:formylglycine-generating enzyme required for sulfatase activity